MDLYDLTHDWFACIRLVAREGRNFNVSASEMKNRLISMMDRMERDSQSSQALRAGFEDVRYALIVYADEVLNTSDWSEAGSWAGDRLEMHYFQTMVGGDRFFSDLEDARRRRVNAEVLGIYYLCIALGFKGIHFDQPEQLRSLQIELCNALPQRLDSRMDDLYPEAYTSESRSFTPRPVTSVGKALFIAAVMAVVFLILSSLVIEFTV